MQQKTVSTHYTPRPFQQVLHSKLKRFNVLSCHRRFGKTVFSVNELLDKALRNTWKMPVYAYISPTYGQSERIAWQMLKQHTKDLPGVTFNEAKLRCIIERPHLRDHITIFLLGAENPDSLRGIYLDGVILDEFAQFDPTVWGLVVRPTLADRRGWAIFISTVKGMNHFYDIYQTAVKNQDKDWFFATYKASQTGVLPQEELDALRAEMTEEQYNQEMECDWGAALTGAYFGKEMAKAEADGRVGKVPHDPALLVDTAWDLGISDSTAIWFTQQYRQEIRVIDYIEVSGIGLPQIAKKLKEEHRKDYSYRDFHWPHDGKARDLSTGKSREETMRELGVRVRIAPKHDVADGINAARLLISKCYFDAEKCDRGLSALKNYERKFDEKLKIYQDKPLHNWASHGADAFRLLALAMKPGEDRQNRQMPTKCLSDYDVFKR